MLELFILLFVVLAMVGIVMVILLKQGLSKRRRRSMDLVTMQVQLLKDDETGIEAAEQLFSGLHGIKEKEGWGLISAPLVLAFEIIARPESIEFYVTVPKEYQEFMEKQVHSTYSGAHIEIVPEVNVFANGGKIAYASLKLSNSSYFPIKKYKDLPTDSLNAITSAISKLESNEAVVVQMAMKPASEGWQKGGRSYLHGLEHNVDDEGKPKVKVDPSVPPAIEDKISKVGFNTSLRLMSVAPTMGRAKSNLKNIVNAYDQFGLSHLAKFKKSTIHFKRRFVEDFVYKQLPLGGSSMVLNIEELATLYHFPSKEVTTPYIGRVLSKMAAAPHNLPEEGLYLGKSKYRGADKGVHVLDDDRRRHMYVIGQTGTGKSEYLKYMAQQDIRNGHGVAFIDPHGDAVEDILKMIPEERMNDVIYFNPADLDNPLGLNILEAKDEQRNLIVNSFIGLLYKLYDPNNTGIMGPMLERAVRNVMLTAMEEDGNSLVEVMRLLTDPEFQKQKIELIKDPMVKRYWTDEIANTSDFHKSEKLGYFVSKFDRFVTDSTMRNIIGQPHSAFDFRKVMDEKKILLVNLSKGLIGEENSNFLGLILVPRLLIAAMSRADVPESQRPDFYLYVDEFQNFATEDFAQILSEARKYHLNLIVGNQFISQIDQKIRDAVFGNVGTLVSFRIGQDDADYLSHQFDPVFSAADLINNTVGNAYVRLLVKGQPTAPFSMATDWPAMQAVERSDERAERIKQLSRSRYGQPREDVEQEILRRGQL